MEKLFTTLTHAVEGTPAIALGAAFLWGILSILLSPCHLASIPLIVGFIDEQGRMSTRRAFAISTLFAVGILITIAAIGAITAAAGRMMGDVGRYGNYFVAAIFFLVGLHLLDVIPAALVGSRPDRHEAQGPAGRVHPRPGLRHRPRPVHLRLHGPDAGRHLQGGLDRPALRNRPARSSTASATARSSSWPAPAPGWCSGT